MGIWLISLSRLCLPWKWQCVKLSKWLDSHSLGPCHHQVSLLCLLGTVSKRIWHLLVGNHAGMYWLKQGPVVLFPHLRLMVQDIAVRAPKGNLGVVRDPVQRQSIIADCNARSAYIRYTAKIIICVRLGSRTWTRSWQVPQFVDCRHGHQMLFERETAYSHWEVSYHLLILIQSQSLFL